MWAYGTHVVLWNMKELGIPSNDYEEVYTWSNHSSTTHWSKDVSDTVVKKLRDALNTLKTNGKLTEIFGPPSLSAHERTGRTPPWLMRIRHARWRVPS